MKLEVIYRQITVIVFFAAFLAQTFSKSFVIVDYYSNMNKYLEKCENKAKIKMNCKGKCQMIKQIEQEEKKDKGNPDRKSENKIETLDFFKPFFALETNYNLKLRKKIYPNFQASKETDRSFEVFHPPSICI